MLITNMTIHTVSGEVIPDGYIYAKDGAIRDLGPMKSCHHADPELYEFPGLQAYPGLVDAHSHIGMFGDGLGFEGDDGNEATDPSTPHLRALDGVNVLDRCFEEALDYGVTTVVTGPGSSNAVCGQSLALKTSGQCVDDMVVDPAVAVKFALGENPKDTYAHRNQTPMTRMATAALIREELYTAKRYLEDLAKAGEDEEGETDPPEYDAKCEALLPLLRGEMAAHFHAHRADDLFTAVRIAKEFGLNAVLIHATEGYLVADRLAKFGYPVVCGPVIASRSKPELARFSRGNPAELAKRGIEVAICTDHPEIPAEFLMLSAGIAHCEGMPREEAIRAVTLTPARICGISDRVGSLEPGKDADIVLYDGDPLCGFLKPAAVFLEGKRVR